MDHKLSRTEEPNERSANIDALSTIDMIRLINDEDKKIALAVEKETERIAAAVDVAVLRKPFGLFLLYSGASMLWSTRKKE